MTEAVTAGRRRFQRPAQMWPIRQPAKTKAIEPLPDQLAIMSTSFTVLAVVVLWFLAQLLLFSGLEQGRAQDRLFGQFRTQLAEATAPVGGIIAPGAPVALLRIPSLDYDQVVVEGTSSGMLLDGPGHRRDTVLPGQAGVSEIFGKSSTFGKPFADIVNRGAGQKMTVVTGQGETTYKISGVRRAGDPMPGALAAGGSRITMVTAGGSSALTPNEVVYVDAELQGTAFVAPSGRLNAIGPSEVPMASDTTVMPALALSLGALALVVVGALFARQRFGVMRTWLIAAPVVLALAWMTSDLTTYLLPNLL